VITVTVDGECLMCGGFSLDKIDRLGNFEFIADYFDNLSLSPKMGDSGAAFMGSTQSGTPSSWWAMIGDSIDKFLTMSSGEGASASPLPGGAAWGPCLLPLQPHNG
jgi:hypothetical protein